MTNITNLLLYISYRLLMDVNVYSWCLFSKILNAHANTLICLRDCCSIFTLPQIWFSHKIVLVNLNLTLPMTANNVVLRFLNQFTNLPSSISNNYTSLEHYNKHIQLLRVHSKYIMFINVHYYIAAVLLYLYISRAHTIVIEKLQVSYFSPSSSNNSFTIITIQQLINNWLIRKYWKHTFLS